MNRKNGRKMQQGNSQKEKVARIHTDFRMGLSREQVQERIDAGEVNREVDASLLSVGDIVRKNVCTYFNLIFAVLAFLVCMVGSFRNLTFLPIVIINTIVGIVQEIRAKNVLDKMNMLHAPHADVVRDGKVVSVDATELVRDDIVLFKNGNQICADAVVCHGQVQVNESLLTGESEEIIKKEGDFLLSGSFITAGSCYARLEKVGEESYISQLTLKAKTMREGEQSEMIRSLDKLVKAAGIAIIPIGIALFWQSYFYNGETMQNSVTAMVAAVIGMIPEGLYLLATLAMTVSSVRLAFKKVLLHDMKSIETLARADVLCVDKTGTITENEMKVKEFVCLDEKQSEGEIQAVLSDFVQAMEADNSTMRALQQYFAKEHLQKPDLLYPFSSVTKYSGAVFGEYTYILGAPEFVLVEKYEQYKELLEQYQKKGYRTLVFGQSEEKPEDKPLQKGVKPLAAVILLNRVRKEAPDTFAYFAKQGVEVKVISGDNPQTVSETAKEAGIPGADCYIDARELKTEEDMDRAVTAYTVFGRVLPEQKRMLIQALKRNGRTVAMAGDGVNDVLALKDADCSVAMASGSEAAMQASQVVLLESDFARMPEVVAEGRRVVNNIQQSASLFLVKNIFSFLLSLISICFVFTYPLEPTQMSLISAFTIGIPGFFLSLQPNSSRIKGNFLLNVFLKALPAGITDALVVASFAVFGSTFSLGSREVSTAATILLAIVGFMILYRISLPMNPVRILIWCGCLTGMIGTILLVPELFGITAMSARCIMLLILFAVATEPIFRYLTKINEKIQELCKKMMLAREEKRNLRQEKRKLRQERRKRFGGKKEKKRER